MINIITMFYFGCSLYFFFAILRSLDTLNHQTIKRNIDESAKEQTRRHYLKEFHGILLDIKRKLTK